MMKYVPLDKKKTKKSLVKADKCFLDGRENQELLLKSKLRWLKEIMHNQLHFSLLLELVKEHIIKNSLPPFISVELPLPDRHLEESSQWKETVSIFSYRLLTILKRRYEDSYKFYSDASQCCIKELTGLVASLRCLPNSDARQKVSSYAANLVNICSDNLFGHYEDYSFENFYWWGIYLLYTIYMYYIAYFDYCIYK